MAVRFQHWFPVSRGEFGEISTTVCNTTLTAFLDAYHNSKDKAAINLGLSRSEVGRLCAKQASCILRNSSEFAQSNMATTNLVLGLLPTILAIIAPSMTELAVVAMHRPFLSAILSISSPAVLQGRVFQYDDPGEVLRTDYQRQDIRFPLTVGPWSVRAATIAGVVGYLLALGSMINTLFLVIELTNSSILSWGCTRTWPLYVWMFVPIVIHALASSGFYLTLQTRQKTDVPISHTVQLCESKSVVDIVDDKSLKEVCQGTSRNAGPLNRRFQALRRRLFEDLVSCASHKHIDYEPRSRDTNDRDMMIGVLLNSAAGFLGFLHIVFATVTFSGLLFVAPLDAIGQVAMRLVVSALFCRCIVMFEIAGLRCRAIKHRESQ